MQSALDWWRDGLLAWLPIGVRHWLAGSTQRLVIAVDDRECVLIREEMGQTQELERLDQRPIDGNSIAAWIKRGKFRYWTLRFPASQALIRAFTLPLAAEKNLRQVAGFEMDRLTPFTATQVYYDVIVLERQSEQRRLRVELTALPRSIVDPVLSSLQQRRVPPDTVAVANAHPSLNLLPPEQRPHRGRWGQRLHAGLIVMSLLLITVAMVLPVWQQRSLAIGAMIAAQRLQDTANQALTLRDQLDQTLTNSRMLMQKKKNMPLKIEVLRELTAIFPDDTWVDRLQINGETLQITGQSAKASALIGIVESSKLFNGTSFLSPVSTDARTGKERFVLGARIEREP